MRLLRAKDHRRMAWKNGGGETTQIAVHPGGAGLDDFDWRVSMARVAESGPFSGFAGIDRTLSILDGAGMVLSIEGRPSARLTAASLPLSFPADVPTRAELIDGPVSDLNVMTRRGIASHRVVRHDETEPHALASGVSMVLCVTGRFRITAGGSTAALEALDAVLLPPDGEARIEGVGRYYAIDIADAGIV